MGFSVVLGVYSFFMDKTRRDVCHARPGTRLLGDSGELEVASAVTKENTEKHGSRYKHFDLSHTKLPYVVSIFITNDLFTTNDPPFEPPQKIIGNVQPSSSDWHR